MSSSPAFVLSDIRFLNMQLKLKPKCLGRSKTAFVQVLPRPLVMKCLSFGATLRGIRNRRPFRGTRLLGAWCRHSVSFPVVRRTLQKAGENLFWLRQGLVWIAHVFVSDSASCRSWIEAIWHDLLGGKSRAAVFQVASSLVKLKSETERASSSVFSDVEAACVEHNVLDCDQCHRPANDRRWAM